LETQFWAGLTMADSGAGKKPGALDSLTKEELVGKCKTLLQIAQKAKKAKDDAQKQSEAIQGENEKENKKLLEQISVLERKVDVNEDVVKAKQRQLDRLSEENDSLLEQMDTYSSQLKIVTKEKSETEKAVTALKSALAKSEKQASKAMELEASMICLQETGKQMASKLKMAEQELAAEKILGSDKTSKLKTITEKLEHAEAEIKAKTEEGSRKGKDNEQDIIPLKEEVDQLNSKLNKCKEEKAQLEVELKDCKDLLDERNKSLSECSDNMKIIHETSKQQVDDIEVLKVQVNKLEVTNKESVNDCEKLRESLDEKQNLLVEKEMNVKHLESVKVQLEGKNLEFEQKNSGLIEELNQFNQEMKKRGERIEKLENVNSDQLMKIRNLEKMNNENNFQGEAMENIKQKLEETEKVVKSTKAEKEKLDEQLLECKSVNDTLQNNEKTLKSHLDESTAEKEIITQNVNELTTEVERLKETLLTNEKIFDSNIQELKKQLAEEQEENNLLQNEKVEKLSNLEFSSQKFDEVNSLLAEAKASSEKLIQEKDELLNQNSAVIIKLEAKCSEIQTLTSKLADFESQIKLKENEVTELNELNNSFTKLLEANVDSKNEDEKAALAHLESKLKETTNTNLKLSGELEAMKFQLEEANDLIEIVKTELKNVKAAEKQTEDKHTALTGELNTSITLANKKIEDLEAKNRDLLDSSLKLESTEAKYDSTMTELKEMKQQAESYKHDFAQENAKNASLTEEKERLEGTVASLESRLETSQLELLKTIKKFDEMKEESSRSKSLNSTLPDNDDSRSEVMSTSTVSRVEESNRMRDVEDSFEDRYSKLKLIAIKLKKKVVDQEKIIKELQIRSSKTVKNEDGDSNNFKDKMASLTKNFNNLQSQYDAAVDKLENVEAEAKTLRKDLEASLSECLASKQKSEESIQQALSAKTELTKMEDKAREAEGKVHSLEITIEEERKERKLLETNAKKTGEQASQLRDIMGEKMLIEETVQSLKLQVVQLEETLSREQERADNAHKTLTSTRAQLTQTEADLARQKIETDELNKKYEDTVRATEVLQEQVGDVIKNSEKEQGQEKNKVLQLERQVSALEANLFAKTQGLDFKDKEFIKVSKEFENYKLRAQSVLKQSKDKAFEEESKKKQDDLFAMEKMNDALNDKLKSLSLEIRTISMERNGLQDEHDRLMERQSLLLQELATKEKSWREKVDQQDAKIKLVEDDKTGNLERIQKSMESLKQIHQQEVERMKSSTQAEMSKLKQQIDAKENEVIRLELVLQKEQEARRQAEETAGRVGVFDNRLDISQIEREACEGQEVDTHSVPSPNNSLVSPLPLEQLLAQSDLTDLISEDLRSTSSSRVGGADRQVCHLAALLSESEAQNSRLEKLTEVLKEEIRTYQRSEERHKHIENLEYVKNVILKFLTLTGAQERVRLIPVLKTILKLKKEEVDKIEELVRADDESQSGGEGWGSYLWSTK